MRRLLVCLAILALPISTLGQSLALDFNPNGTVESITCTETSSGPEQNPVAAWIIASVAVAGFLTEHGPTIIGWIRDMANPPEEPEIPPEQQVELFRALMDACRDRGEPVEANTAPLQ